jgi:DNA-binding response OmpR family regulator
MSIDVLLAHSTCEYANRLAARLRTERFARVITASSGRTAIARLRQAQFDVLVASESLGDIDCWRLIRILRSGRFGQASLPAVVLCDPRRARTLRTIADDHGALLAADENPDLLKDDIRRAVAGRRTPSVLIIEDDASAADAARIALEKPYEVEVCTDGEHGLKAWEARRHDLVLLDVMLPNLSGPAVLRRIIDADPRQAYSLSRGQTGHASHHLRNALALCERGELSDDEWAHLLHEAE